LAGGCAQIHNFTHLDYVGSRAYDGWSLEGGNGGLRLVDTSLSLGCSSELGTPSGCGCAEDAYFIKCIKKAGGRLGSSKEQEAFGTQNYFADRSFGAHQANIELTWTDNKSITTFRDYCPEYLRSMKLL
jgi:hypothetical protein